MIGGLAARGLEPDQVYCLPLSAGSFGDAIEEERRPLLSNPHPPTLVLYQFRRTHGGIPPLRLRSVLGAYEEEERHTLSTRPQVSKVLPGCGLKLPSGWLAGTMGHLALSRSF
jgi:hypothetical protein